MTNRFSYPPAPEDHPARFPWWDTFDARLDIEVSGGDTAEGLDALHVWHATARIVDASGSPLTLNAEDLDAYGIEPDTDGALPSLPSTHVARMTLCVVNPSLGDPLDSLDAIAQDLIDLGVSVWDHDGEATPEFNSFCNGMAWNPTVLVRSFMVIPEYRGTALSPALAALMLKPFAALNIETAALTARPLAMSDLTRAEQESSVERLRAFWATLGFERLGVSDQMAAPLNYFDLANIVNEATAHDPGLADLLPHQG